jgi:hypothetical protein
MFHTGNIALRIAFSEISLDVCIPLLTNKTGAPPRLSFIINIVDIS